MKIRTSCGEAPVPVTTFPGGEQIPNFSGLDLTLGRDGVVIIDQSISTPADLLNVAEASAVLQGFKDISKVFLYAPYILGARQDRQCSPGEPVTAKVVADLINSLGLDGVYTYVPHSDVLPACLDRCHPDHDMTELVLAAMHYAGADGNERHAIIAPDYGATKRTLQLAESLRKEGKDAFFVQGRKARDPETGELSGFGVEGFQADTAWVVDDVCANGGTFLGLADAIAEKGEFNDGLNLVVAHADHMHGLEKCQTKYDGVYVSNSRPLQPTENHNVIIIDIH